MPDWIAEIEDECVECGLCLKACAFLQKYGSPGALARQCRSTDQGCQDFAFECSLCDLCQSVCPNRVVPSRLVLGMIFPGDKV